MMIDNYLPQIKNDQDFSKTWSRNVYLAALTAVCFTAFIISAILKSKAGAIIFLATAIASGSALAIQARRCDLYTAQMLQNKKQKDAEFKMGLALSNQLRKMDSEKSN